MECLGVKSLRWVKFAKGRLEATLFAASLHRCRTQHLRPLVRPLFLFGEVFAWVTSLRGRDLALDGATLFKQSNLLFDTLDLIESLMRLGQVAAHLVDLGPKPAVVLLFLVFSVRLSNVPPCILPTLNFSVEVEALVTMSHLCLSLVIEGLRPESCLIILLCQHDLLCPHLFLLLHQLVFAVQGLNNVATLCLHLVFAFLCVFDRLCRDVGLGLDGLLYRYFCWLGDARVSADRLRLQLVDIEALVLGCDLRLPTPAELQVSILIKNDHFGQALFIFGSLAVDLALGHLGPANNHQHVRKIVHRKAITGRALYQFPQLFKERVVLLLRRHVFREESHRGED